MKILAQTMKVFHEAVGFIKRLAEIIALIWRLVFFSLEKPEVKFRIFFEKAGGGFIKLGQILALRHDILPARYTDELLKLLASVPAAPFAQMEKVFIDEIGQRPEAFFQTFDAVPIASASISQVYKATLKTGEEVVVKIQRPGIVEAFERDFILASFLAGLVGIFKITRAVNIYEAVDEFIAWTKRELDFRYEARNGAALYQHSARHPDTVIPKVYLNLCTERVLVMEYMRGVARLDGVLSKLGKNPNFRQDILRDHRIDLSHMAYYFMIDGMRQYFIDGFFHADPHPANVFLLPDNRLGYFDFGIMGEVGRDRIDLLRIMYGLAHRDIDSVSRLFLAFSKRSLEPEIELFKRYRKIDHARYVKVIDKIEEIIADNFCKELEDILLPWYDKEAPKQSAAVLFSKLLLKAENYSVCLPRTATIFFRSLIIADMVALKLDPEFDMIQAFQMFFQKFPLERATEIIEEKTHEIELLPQIDPVTHFNFEQLLEYKSYERERLAIATERLANMVSYYAERYDEVRKLL